MRKLKRVEISAATAVSAGEGLFWAALTGLVLVALVSLAGCSQSGGSVLNPDSIITPIVGVEIVQIDEVMDDEDGKIKSANLQGWRLFSDRAFEHDDLVVALSITKLRHGREIEARTTYAVIPKGKTDSDTFLFNDEGEWSDERRIHVLETPTRGTLPVGQLETEDGILIPRMYPWYEYRIHGVVRWEL